MTAFSDACRELQRVLEATYKRYADLTLYDLDEQVDGALQESTNKAGERLAKLAEVDEARDAAARKRLVDDIQTTQPIVKENFL